MNSEDIKDISLAFAHTFASNLPTTESRYASMCKASCDIDKSPRNLIRFAAEVAEIIYDVHPIKKKEFSSSARHRTAKEVNTILSEYIDSHYMPLSKHSIEDRITLFFASISRLYIRLQTAQKEMSIPQSLIDEATAEFKDLKLAAAAYKLCSVKKARDIIDGSGMPL